MFARRLAVFLAVVRGGSCLLCPTVAWSVPSRCAHVRAPAPSSLMKWKASESSATPIVFGKVKGLSRRSLLTVPLGGVFLSWSEEARADAVGVGVRITAKKRYDARVEQGALAFESLKKAVTSADFKAIGEFAESDSFADFKSAALLLASSFRTSAGQRPEKVQQNVKFNAFLSDVADMQKAAKKKNAEALQTSFGAGLEHLAAYRVSVSDVY